MLTTALAAALLPLSACSQSEYDACHDAAVDEMKNAQEAGAANGGSNSIGGYFDEQQAYADSKCAGLPDD